MRLEERQEDAERTLGFASLEHLDGQLDDSIITRAAPIPGRREPHRRRMLRFVDGREFRGGTSGIAPFCETAGESLRRQHVVLAKQEDVITRLSQVPEQDRKSVVEGKSVDLGG